MTLLLPASLAGDAESVRRAWRPAIRKAVRTGEWPEATDLTDVSQLQGLIAVQPAPLLAGERHVHPFVPIALLREAAERGRLLRDVEDQLFAQALGAPWSVLGLLCPAEQIFVLPPDRHRPLVSSVVRFWSELDEPGPRYTFGLREGARLWDVPTGLKYVLGQLGVPRRDLSRELPPEGLAALTTFIDGEL